MNKIDHNRQMMLVKVDGTDEWRPFDVIAAPLRLSGPAPQVGDNERREQLVDGTWLIWTTERRRP